MAVARVLPNIVADEASYGFDFIASMEESVVIPIKASVEILIGRLFIDIDPTVAFDQWITCTFYNKAVAHGKDAFYRTVGKIVRDEIATATTGIDADLILSDYGAFSPHDLILIDPVGSPEWARLKTVAITSVAEDSITGVHAIGTPVVRVIEFQCPIYCLDGTDSIYCKIEFDTIQTIHLNMNLTLRT